MLKILLIGMEDFKERVEGNYYVDKNKIYRGVLLDGTKIKLFCCPMR